MDPENVGTEAIVRVTHWLRGIWEMRRRGGPVQQWVDSIPSYANSTAAGENQTPVESGNPKSLRVEKTTPVQIDDKRRKRVEDMTASAPVSIPSSPAITMTLPPSSVPHHRLARDPSLQSDSSHCSSVESLLEWRKADPEAILLGLGFGYPSSPQENGSMARIPRRFLQPSKLKGIAVDEFLKQQQESNESLDSASLGYRGLTGSDSTLCVPTRFPRRRHSGPSDLEQLRTNISRIGPTVLHILHNNQLILYSSVFSVALAQIPFDSPICGEKMNSNPSEGSPYVAPSEIVQKIMERLKEHESHENDSFTHTNSSGDLFGTMQQDGRLSVLSPDNRQYLERPRSKSPDMRNKRMIIGEKSFAFGYNGDLIEIPSMNREDEDLDINSNDYQISSDDPRIKLEESMSPEEEKPAKLSTRRLAKQLSFDDDHSNYSSRDTIHTMERREYPALAEEQRDSLTTIVSKWSESTEPCGSISASFDEATSTSTPPLRRASDGICDFKMRRNILACNEERRMSDSGIHAKVQRSGKPGLKRQARVSDADEKYSENVATNNSAEREKDIKPDIKTRDFRATEGEASSFGNQSEPEEGKICIDDNQECCKNDELDQICEHEETATDCCCYSRSSNCWRKLTRVLKEKKELEEVVAKESKEKKQLQEVVAKKSREMALLREKLNSVMSVRMEPGF